MKKADRQIYLILGEEIKWSICGFCRYLECDGSPCNDGNYECKHPLEVVAEDIGDYIGGPGEDCWGFSPHVNVRDCADIVGCILAQGWDPSLCMWSKEKDKISVAGMKHEQS